MPGPAAAADPRRGARPSSIVVDSLLRGCCSAQSLAPRKPVRLSFLSALVPAQEARRMTLREGVNNHARRVLLAALLFASLQAAAGFKLPLGWLASDHATEAGGKAHIRRHPSPTSYVFRMSIGGADSSSDSTSSTSSSSAAAAWKVSELGAVHGAKLELPLCTGGTVELTLHESAILPPDLRAAEPDLLPFDGYGTSSVDGSGVHADITFTTIGIHAQLWTSKGVCYVDPHSAGRSDVYSVYHASDPHPSGANPYPARVRDAGRGVDPMDPLTHDYLAKQQSRRSLQDASTTGGTPGFTLVTPPQGQTWQRTYRIAVLPTYEYAQFAATTGLTTMALMTMSFQRALGVWSREHGFYFQFASTQSSLMNLAQNALPNNNLDPSMKAAPALAASLGLLESQYDFGHIVCIGGAGGMGGGQPCSDPTSKWAGATCGTAPMGDSFDVEYLAHEMAHQFGLSHVWSGMRGGCTADQFSPAGALEVGSGSTLVTYAGICGSGYSDPDNADDVVVAQMGNTIVNAAGVTVKKSSSLPYFHVLSLSQFENAFWYGGQMTPTLIQQTGFACNPTDTYCNSTGNPTYFANVRNYGSVSPSNTCGIWTLSKNNRPTVTVPPTCNIPKNTPFVLAGTGVDTDTTDTLAYNWEQVDPSPKRVALGVENREGPLYVSAVPSLQGNVRFMPQWSTLMGPWQNITNFADPLERLSSVNRTLHFAMTVRDHFFANGTSNINATWNSTGGLGTAVPIIGSWHSALSNVVVADLGPLNILVPNASFTTYDAAGAPSLQLNVVVKLSGLADFNKKLKANSATSPLSPESSAMANTNWTVYTQKLTAACQLNDPTCPWVSTGQVINVATSSAGTGNALVNFNSIGTYNVIVADPAIALSTTTAFCGGFTLVTVTVVNINTASSGAPASRAAHVRYSAVPTGASWTTTPILPQTTIPSTGLPVPVSSLGFASSLLGGTAPLNTTNTAALWDDADSSNEACIFNLAAPDFTGPDSAGLVTANFAAAGCFLYPSTNYTFVLAANSFGASTNVAANFTFFTADDTVPPFVNSTSPLPRSTGQQEDDSITFYFSEWIDVLPGGNFTFTPTNPANGAPFNLTVPSCYPGDCDLPDQLIVASDDFYIQLYPPSTLASLSNYTVTISNNTVSDIAGLILAPYSLSFQTGDSYAPYMTNAQTFMNSSMLGWCFTFSEPILPSRGNIYFQTGNFSNMVANNYWLTYLTGLDSAFNLVNPNATSQLNFLVQRAVTDTTCSFVYNKTSLCGYVPILAANAAPNAFSLPASVTSTPVGIFVGPNIVMDIAGNQIAVPLATKAPQDIMNLTKGGNASSAGNFFSAAIAPIVLAGVTTASPPPPSPKPPSPPPSPPPPSPPPTYAILTVSMRMTGISVASFNTTAVRTVFINTVAASVNVSAGYITINNVTASTSRRHLNAVGDAVVSYSVKVTSATAAAAATASLNNLTTAAGASAFTSLLNTNLATAGVTGVTLTGIVATTTTPAAAPTASSASLPPHATIGLLLAALLATAL